MEKKRTILIIEDDFGTKIGAFNDALQKNNFDVVRAENLEEATEKMQELLAKNILDGIILDFSFPKSKEDQTRVSEQNVPNGVVFFEKFKFRIRNMQIPIVLNTTAAEEIKTEYLGDLDHLGTPVYNVNHDANPLATAENQMFIKDIFALFNNRNEMRKQSQNIGEEIKWNIGGSIVKGPNGKLSYRENRGG